MALPKPVKRQAIHSRKIECTGYLREDDLWDIEARLFDFKHYPFETIERGTLKEGDAVHLMDLRVTLDDSMTIRDIYAEMQAAPFELCRKVPPRFERLIGVSIGSGWIAQVKQLLEGTDGCTHLIEMLKVVATTGYQTIHPYRFKNTQGPKIIHPSIIDKCQGFASAGEVVQKHFPEFADKS